MEEFVFYIKGDVEHPLTIDPSVWIFDERKVDLDTYFDESIIKDDEETAYKKAISAQWDKELLEGSSPPRPNSNGNEISYDKQTLFTSSFGMPLKPFLLNTKPLETVTQVKVVSVDGTEVQCDVEDAYQFIVGFSNKGQPLKEDGPVHIYYGDGSNQQNPLKQVKEIILL